MIRMTMLLLACIVATMVFYGDDTGTASGPADRSAAAGNGDGAGFFSQIGSLLDEAAAPEGDILDRIPLEDERRAIQVALEATVPPDSPAPPKPQTIHLTAAGQVEAPSAPREPRTAAAPQDTGLWYVTGNRVNLRGGPSTSDAVVGQVVLGDAAEVLEETADGWYRIRTTEGGETGFIFGRFLSQNRPG